MATLRHYIAGFAEIENEKKFKLWLLNNSLKCCQQLDLETFLLRLEEEDLYEPPDILAFAKQFLRQLKIDNQVLFISVVFEPSEVDNFDDFEYIKKTVQELLAKKDNESAGLRNCKFRYLKRLE